MLNIHRLVLVVAVAMNAVAVGLGIALEFQIIHAFNSVAIVVCGYIASKETI